MIIAILLLCVVPAVMANSSGPPVGQNPNLCTDMIPTGHNNGVSLATDQTSPPYTITTSASEYTTGGSILVTITGTGGNQFKGFFIQARRADPALDNDVAIGTFANAPTGTGLLMCHNVANSAWSHTTATAESVVTATWNSPAQDEGPIEFKATIVKGVPDRSYFYTDVKSAQVSFMNGAGDNTTQTPAGTTSSAAGTTSSAAGTTSSGPTNAVSFPLATLVVMLAAFLAVVHY